MRSWFGFLFLPSITLYITQASTIANLLNPTPSLSSPAHPAGSTSLLPPLQNVTTIFTFLETVMLTVIATTHTYPTATFRLVRISSPTGRPATSLESFTAIRITFSIHDPTYNSINVDMTSRWQIWNPPVFSHDPVPADFGNMRLDVRMDIREAWQIMKAFGDYETFDSTLLYWPMLPPKTGKQQPYYRFDVVKPHEELVYVGAWTKKATKSLGSGGLGNLSVLGAGAGDVVRRVGNVVEGEKFLVGGKENCVVVAQEINWGHWESLVPHKPLPNTLSFIIWRDR